MARFIKSASGFLPYPARRTKYQGRELVGDGETLLASNLTQTCMLGGYGVTSYRPTYRRTGIFAVFFLLLVEYRVRKEMETGLFLGYLKNLGANEALVGKTYGVGLDVDQVFTTNLQLSYNLPHWKLGVEYSPSIAWYGNGICKMADGFMTHSITNHRVLGVLIYTF